ncbi:MAG: NADP-dependent malic enzyme [Bacteroidia bacterium]
MPKKIRPQEALDYHSQGRAGKIEVISSKPTNSQRDLALTYSPGVAEPCKAIDEDKSNVFKYTAKGNLVGIITNGTAVLGLGDIGPEAAKPVMEGKAVLFKVFADIDCFDLEISEKKAEDFIKVVKALEPTFGGINLEDIASPECFEIERRLKQEMNIPVMHDDQHGTSIIVGAALLNALQLVKKKIEKVRVVVSGAGASAISCSRLITSLGIKKENLLMTDSTGVLSTARNDIAEIKTEFARDTTKESLADAMEGADVFIGLSVGGIVSAQMLKSMAKNPVVFALANPDPEIDYPEAVKVRKDLLMATGRSDYPNQVNNVLGFPFIFRGALDVRATAINEEMKLAAVHALADLAKKPVPELVTLAYNEKVINFGKDYIIPKPLDPRLLTTVAPAVAKAAVDSGVARIKIQDWDQYEMVLSSRLGIDSQIAQVIMSKARKNPKRVLFAEADSRKILKAAQMVREDGIAEPLLMGNIARIRELIKEHKLGLEDCKMIDPLEESRKRQEFGDHLFRKRPRKGLTQFEAVSLMRNRNYFASMMVELGEADALISGMTRKYPDTIRPALQIIGHEDGLDKVAGMYIMITKRGPLFFADTTVNVDPSAETIMKITELVARQVRQFNIKPRIALLSYGNFGSSEGESPQKVARAYKMLKEKYPDMVVDGELQANFALNDNLLKEYFPFSHLVDKSVNTLIFPNLSSGNIAYKLLQELAGAEAIGPVLLGLKKPVHILQLGSSIREIVNMVAIAVVDAQNKNRK